MLVRHNTSLLEEAISHVVRQAAIPTLQAEAELAVQRDRATAIRRVATGAAIAVAALGIGWGIYLTFGPQGHGFTPVAAGAVANDHQTANTVTPGVGKVVVDSPATKTTTKMGVPSVTPELPDRHDAQADAAAPTQAGPVTTDFSKFNSVEVDMFGKRWALRAGHHFSSETDQTWDAAWCYTNQATDGVFVQVDLLNRSSPNTAPTGPIANDQTLANVGLTVANALSLSTECPWLDGAKYDVSDINKTRPLPQSTLPKISLTGDTLYYDGEIRPGFLVQLSSKKFQNLNITSDGGLLLEALMAGRWLRSNGKNVTVTGECYSACVFVLAGGNDRTAAAAAQIGVHQFFSAEIHDAVGATADAQKVSSDIVRFLDAMNISSELFHAMADTPAQSILVLDHDRLREWRLLTGAKPSTDSLDEVTAVARSGVARSPSGSVPVYSGPNEKTTKVGDLQTGAKVNILSPEGAWYQIRTATGQTGYAYQSLIKVDQYVDIGFSRKFIQVRSVATLEEARNAVLSSHLELAAYLASNGWYAIVVDRTYMDNEATGEVAKLKVTGQIPADSFKTFGNTYIRKVCCD